jgi:hypothetical protein
VRIWFEVAAAEVGKIHLKALKNLPICQSDLLQVSPPQIKAVIFARLAPQGWQRNKP